MGATPSAKKQRSRWDETPAGVALGPGATPAMGVGATPMGFGVTPGMTPMGGSDMATPSPSQLGKVPMTAEQYQARPFAPGSYSLLRDSATGASDRILPEDRVALDGQCDSAIPVPSQLGKVFMTFERYQARLHAYGRVRPDALLGWGFAHRPQRWSLQACCCAACSLSSTLICLLLIANVTQARVLRLTRVMCKTNPVAVRCAGNAAGPGGG